MLKKESPKPVASTSVKAGATVLPLIESMAQPDPLVGIATDPGLRDLVLPSAADWISSRARFSSLGSFRAAVGDSWTTWEIGARGGTRFKKAARVPAPIEIALAAIAPTTVDSGETLNVNITAKNNSSETLQTQGPVPDFVCEEGVVFCTRGFPDVNNAFRVGIDFTGRTGWDHPYRWGLDRARRFCQDALSS